MSEIKKIKKLEERDDEFSVKESDIPLNSFKSLRFISKDIKTNLNVKLI